MRIVIDLQGAQTESRFRGIGRFSTAIAKAIIENCREHQIYLVLNGLFSETISAIFADFEGVIDPANIMVWNAPGPVRYMEADNGWHREVAQLLREHFIASLQPDVLYIPSLFEGYVDDAVLSVGKFYDTAPVCVTLYDLIPLMNADKYLNCNSSYKSYYMERVESLKSASTLFAISESSKQEGVKYLDSFKGSIINSSIGSDALFCVENIPLDQKNEILKRYTLKDSFVLYTGGADERKNLNALVLAYADISKELREENQLVLAGRMPESEVERLKATAAAAGLEQNELVFLGYIEDKDLVCLYNICRLFVFPSWHEGFGLPPLEAMLCGAVVIGSNVSSIPEVIGFPDALFDPYSRNSIKDAIEKGLKDEEFRHLFKAHSISQVRKFSWKDSANTIIDAMEKLAVPALKRNWAQSYAAQEAEYKRVISEVAALVIKYSVVNDERLVKCSIAINQNFKIIQNASRTTLNHEKLVWRVEGPFDSSYSLALLNRETAIALDSLGHHVVLHSTEGGGDFYPNESIFSKEPKLKELFDRSIKVGSLSSDVVSRNLYPPRVEDMNSNFNMLHHYAWEESGFPPEWVDNFNEYLQGITCLSHHVEKVLIDNGVSVPLSTSGCGVDHWLRIQADKSFSVKAKDFKFLHVSSCFPRKGADVLLKAYGDVFTSSDPVTLIIKTFKNPHNLIHEWLADAANQRSDFPHVVVIEDDLTDSELKSLYLSSDVLVAPSRAEGFGLPLAEAMLSDLPVITTGWGGQMDFCNEDNSWLIDYSFSSAQSHFELFGSVWAEPKRAHLGEIMREVYSTPASHRVQKSFKGKQLLLRDFTWQAVSARLVTSAQKWSANSKVVKGSIGWITSWNTRCGIASYSEHLVGNFPVPLHILAPRASDLVSVDDEMVVRCWATSENERLVELSAQIELLKLDILVVQFNYGFYDFHSFSDFVNAQVDKGRVVVVIMHATVDPVHVPHRKLSMLRSALSRCDRVFVHAIPDMNRLKDLSLVDNVAIFPHGILDYSTKTPELNRVFKVASYGFFLPHKGLLELIEAIGLLRNKGVKVELHMVNAEYPAAESKNIIQKAEEKIIELGLRDVVVLNTAFLPDSECLDKLSGMDLIVFPYQNTGESSSAAVRYGLVTGRPVAVTPLPIFDDVKSAVHHLPGMTPLEIASGIESLIGNIASDQGQNVALNAERWREAHRYSKVASRLHNILQALYLRKQLNR